MTKLFMLRTAIRQLAHPLAVAASGLFMAALTILPITQVPPASAQSVRCPCFSEMFIVAACGRQQSCRVFEISPFSTGFECPTGPESSDPGSWLFVTDFTNEANIQCRATVQTGTATPAHLPGHTDRLTEAELQECSNVMVRAAETLGCAN